MVCHSVVPMITLLASSVTNRTWTSEGIMHLPCAFRRWSPARTCAAVMVLHESVCGFNIFLSVSPLQGYLKPRVLKMVLASYGYVKPVVRTGGRDCLGTAPLGDPLPCADQRNEWYVLLASRPALDQVQIARFQPASVIPASARRCQ